VKPLKASGLTGGQGAGSEAISRHWIASSKYTLLAAEYILLYLPCCFDSHSVVLTSSSLLRSVRPATAARDVPLANHRSFYFEGRPP
jgi:hypothetical protein